MKNNHHTISNLTFNQIQFASAVFGDLCLEVCSPKELQRYRYGTGAWTWRCKGHRNILTSTECLYSLDFHQSSMILFHMTPIIDQEKNLRFFLKSCLGLQEF